ncbi:alpha-(1,6)-fucosyltransferase isoform X2 [Anabrus simplex]|uniref:alpha-(1,6)-fucosyltransferase isoform X2 n=1 Tax=Anabrus simplex TaxID=316456 RepID=UPI0035A2A74D
MDTVFKEYADMKLLRQVGWRRALLLLAVVWLLLLLLVASPILRPPSPELNPQTARRLMQAFNDLEILKKQHSELRSLFVDIGDPNLQQEDKIALYHNLREKLKHAENLLDQNDLAGTGVEPREEPSTQYEQLRRRISNGVEEFWYFVSAELKKLQKQAQSLSPQLGTKVTHILEEGVEHRRALLNDIKALSEADGYSAWREKEANDLSDLVQRRLQYLQNPPDCSQARKLVCNLNKGCGYGCQLHHAVYCFMVAYGTQRTLILKSRGWRYHKAGWEEVFLPVSNTCHDASGSSHSHWPGKPNTQVIDLPIIDSLSPRSPYLPLAIPADLAPRLTRLHGDPIVWWVGQFLKYLLRPQEATKTLLDEAQRRHGFERPIVGVHIRRTDKVGTEAAFHPIEQYMSAVEEYFDLLEMRQPVPQRRVYLASDDPKVIVETKRKYPHYEILGDPVVAKTAAVATRYSDSSLNGIIIDIHFLSMTDYLVCTFSSQVCRVAYEIMQTMYPDAADRFRSLDDIYYYGGQSAHNRIATIAHQSRSSSEMDLKVGDLVGVAGNHWNGYSKGKNLRTNQLGMYPSFKVVDKVEVVDFPTYPEVPLKKPQSSPES